MTATESLVGFKYEGLYRAIRQQLEREPIPESGPLFSEKDIQDRYGASRTTVRKALSRLEAEGLIVRKKRLGTFPGEILLSKPAAATLSGQTQRAEDMSARFPIKESAIAWLKPPHPVAEELNLDPEDDVLCFSRVRDVGDSALVSMMSWFRPDVGRALDLDSLHTSPPIVLFEHAGFTISHTIQRTTASAATVEMSRRLGVKKNAVLMIIKSTVYDELSQPMSYAEHCSPADRFEIRRKIAPDGVEGLPDIVRLPQT